MQTVAIRGECDVCGQAVTVAQERLVTQDGRYRHVDCNKVGCPVCVWRAKCMYACMYVSLYVCVCVFSKHVICVYICVRMRNVAVSAR